MTLDRSPRIPFKWRTHIHTYTHTQTKTPSLPSVATRNDVSPLGPAPQGAWNFAIGQDALATRPRLGDGALIDSGGGHRALPPWCANVCAVLCWTRGRRPWQQRLCLLSLSVCRCEEVEAAGWTTKAVFQAAATVAAGGDSHTRSSRSSRSVRKDKAPLRPRHVRTPRAPRQRSLLAPLDLGPTC